MKIYNPKFCKIFFDNRHVLFLSICHQLIFRKNIFLLNNLVERNNIQNADATFKKRVELNE